MDSLKLTRRHPQDADLKPPDKAPFRGRALGADMVRQEAPKGATLTEGGDLKPPKGATRGPKGRL